MIKKFASPFIVIVFLCLSFQMLYAYLDRAPDTDEAAHMQEARNIRKTGLPFESIQDRIFSLQHPPTFCYLVAFFFVLFGEGLFVGRLVSTIFSVAILILVYRIARQYRDEKTALFVTFILAINPAFLYYSHSVYMEISLAFFSLMSLFLFLEAEKNGKLKYFWLSGLFLGLSVITKYSGLVLLAFFILYFLIQHRSKFLLKQEVLVFLLPLIGCLIAWFIFGYVLDRREFLYRLKWWLESEETSPYSWRNVSNFTYLKELIGVITPGFLLIVLYGMYKWIKTKAWKSVTSSLSHPYPSPQRENENSRDKKLMSALLMLLPIYFALYIFFLFSMPTKDIKYVIPLLPFFSIFVDSNVQFDLKFESNLKGIGTSLLLAVLVFNLSPLSFMYDPTSGRFHENLWWFGIKRDYQYRAYKEIGLFLKTKLKPTDAFLCENKAAILRYYADTRYINEWGCPAEEIQSDIPKAKALVFEDDLPYISNLENEQLREKAKEGFRMEKSFVRKDGKHFWVYLRKDN